MTTKKNAADRLHIIAAEIDLCVEGDDPDEPLPSWVEQIQQIANELEADHQRRKYGR